MDHGERRSHEVALRAVQKQPAKPWRGGGNLPAPPKVYRVEPREFRELVQRLTGAGQGDAKRARQAAAAAPPPPLMVPAGYMAVDAPETSQFYASWCSFPLLSPASMATLDGHHGNGALL